MVKASKHQWGKSRTKIKKHTLINGLENNIKMSILSSSTLTSKLAQSKSHNAYSHRDKLIKILHGKKRSQDTKNNFGKQGQIWKLQTSQFQDTL